MRINDLLKRSLETAEMVVLRLLEDLPDASWDLRPHPQCQDLNWQFGHLILSEANMIEGSLGDSLLLDASFQESYRKRELTGISTSDLSEDKGTQASTQATGRLSPADLWSVYRRQRKRTFELLDGLHAEDFDAAAAESIRGYCPTIADAFIACSSHWLMHSGQWVILRRMAGLPIVL